MPGVVFSRVKTITPVIPQVQFLVSPSREMQRCATSLRVGDRYARYQRDIKQSGRLTLVRTSTAQKPILINSHPAKDV